MRSLIGGICALVLLLGCTDARDISTPKPSERLPEDAGPVDAGTDAGPLLPPPPVFDGSFAEAGEVPECSLLVGARCDGDEDCRVGQVCCGEFDPDALTYLAIECRDTCNAPNDFPFCHPGDACSDPTRVCRRSMIVPYDFFSVCADPTPNVQSGVGLAIDDAILCGDQQCNAGTEQCCLRAKTALSGGVAVLAPYCAPIDEDCSCTRASTTSDDAGFEDGGP